MWFSKRARSGATLLLGDAALAFWPNDAAAGHCSASLWPRAGRSDWQRLMALAELVLSQHAEGLSTLDVRLAWSWQRAQAIAWRRGGPDMSALPKTFEQAFGNAAGDWHVCTSMHRYGEPGIAFGIPAAHIAGLQALAKSANSKLVRVEPLALEVLAGLDKKRCHAVVLEPTSVIRVERRNGQLIGISSERWFGDARKAVSGFWQRSRLRSPALAAEKDVVFIDLRERAIRFTLPVEFVELPMSRRIGWRLPGAAQ